MGSKCSDQHLRQALRALPAPDPGRDFEARMLARVLSHREPQGVTPPVAKNRFALSVAMAASLVLGVLLAPLLDRTAGAPEMIAAVESPVTRPVHVRLDSAVALSGATIRVQLPAHARIQGYENLRQLEWQADISAGANQITLPLQLDAALAAEPGSQLTLEVEYRGAKKTLRYAIPAAPQAAPATQPMTQL